ncbi:hypothetical protein PsorP6_009161 [Peronosclerospora sorghi]|uniref:Uncharacterized protein n=1 Tax=Peronosclerospora sorghi TaxID=230839 RepID=A0ACC0VXS4_9STRA|nr:hypothetical protein PsorP6_009161 [Peronosclerospora sorghi]
MGTFVEVPLPPGRKAVKSNLDKYKARVVSKGFSQRYEEDYTETFSPVASRSWYEKLRAYLITDNCLFIKGADETLMIILVYVDDILAFAMRDADLFDFKASMEAAFEVNNFNDINYFLGLELQWSFSGDELRVSQHKYADTILDRFGMKNVRPAATPMEEQYRNYLFQEQDLTTFNPRPALGALLYLSVLTRPDISTAVRLLAQETERTTAALKARIENVFRYLKSTKEYGLVIRDGTEHDGLVVYCDAAFAVERERKSSTGFAIFYDGNLVEWGSKKQGTVTFIVDRS